MIMRDIIAIIETMGGPRPGMLGVKQRLSDEMDNVERDDETDPDTSSLVDQWAIIDECWITESGGLMLFRELVVKKPWMKSLKSRGHCCWSTSNIGAHAYNHSESRNPNTVRLLLIAELTANTPGVDWESVWEGILELHHVGENEFQPPKGTPLIVRQVEVDGVAQTNCPIIGKKVFV